MFCCLNLLKKKVLLPNLYCFFMGSGGVVFYSENIVIRTDVICSVYDRTYLFPHRVFGCFYTNLEKSE
jgi:hypothetical protein